MLSRTPVILFVMSHWRRECGGLMDGLDLGLSHDFRLSVMASYNLAIKRYGAWGRAVTVVIMLVAAGLFASPSWRVLQLLPLVAGLALAWVDAHPAALDRVTGSRNRLQWLAAQTTALSVVAAFNLAGLLEGTGVVAAGLLFAGPLAVSMPPGVRVTALVAVTAFAWNAFSQVVADPGYYNTDPAPGRLMVIGRWLLPAAAAIAAFVLFIGVGAPRPVAPLVPWWVAALLASSLLLMWPYVGMLNLLLRYASSSADAEVAGNLAHQANIHREYVHRAKNELRPQVRDITSDAEYDAFSAAVVVVENVRRDIRASASANLDDAHQVAELWHSYQGTLGNAAIRSRLRLVDLTGDRKLSHMEGLILQSIFVSFVSNALRASPTGPVMVTVSDEMDEEQTPHVRVIVEDDGMGGAPSVFDQGSSLASLDLLCGRFGGGVRIADRESGGTRAVATFAYPYRLSGSTGQTNDLLRGEIADGQLSGPVARRRSARHIGRRGLALPRK
jgi:signal transduction histidine kinase